MIVVSEFPTDLEPLPTAPYAERPLSLPLEPEECRTALWMVRGNITEAAKLIKVTPSRLRSFVNKSAYLSAELQEAKEQLVDIAEDVVYDALTDEEDKGRKDTMARYVLSSQGKPRGWGTAVGQGISVKNSAGGTIIVQWADGTSFGSTSDGSLSASEEDAEGGSGEASQPPSTHFIDREHLVIEHEDNAA